jgi:hypothetical protein
MSKILQAALGLAAIIVACSISFVCWQLCRMGQQITDNENRNADMITRSVVMNLGKIGAVVDSTKATVDHLDRSLTAVDTTLEKVNAPCQPVRGTVYAPDDDKPCGTLADVQRTLHTFRATAGTVLVAGRHFDKSLTTYDKQEFTLYTNVNAAVKNLGDTIDFAHALMAAHEQFLDELQRLAHNSADTMQETHGISKDIHTATTKMNTPKTKQQRILEWAPVVVKGVISTACIATGAC